MDDALPISRLATPTFMLRGPIGTVPLPILGAVFGVLHPALGVEMIASGVGFRVAGGG